MDLFHKNKRPKDHKQISTTRVGTN